jgi:hypothetical protein
MLKNHKKLKKYQYLYLKEKLSSKDYYNEINYSESLNERIGFYYKWLEKINRRYNYA